jgi:hypothetical protein
LDFSWGLLVVAALLLVVVCRRRLVRGRLVSSAAGRKTKGHK